jgi:hypothetical protein
VTQKLCNRVNSNGTQDILALEVRNLTATEFLHAKVNILFLENLISEFDI